MCINNAIISIHGGILKSRADWNKRRFHPFSGRMEPLAGLMLNDKFACNICPCQLLPVQQVGKYPNYKKQYRRCCHNNTPNCH